MLRAEQAFLFGIPECEQDRPPRRVGQLAEGPGQCQQTGVAAGVVVGAIVDLPDRPTAVLRVP